MICSARNYIVSSILLNIDVIKVYFPLSVSRNAKTSKYNIGVLSVKSNKLQATSRHTFLPVHPSVIPTLNQEEAQCSSKLKSYTYDDLKKATRNFHPKGLLGEGAFGLVFKGWIDEKTFAAAKWGTGLVVAVKILDQKETLRTKAWLVSIKIFEIYYVYSCYFSFWDKLKERIRNWRCYLP